MRGIILVSPDPALQIPRPLRTSQSIVSVVNPCASRGVGFVSPDEEYAGRLGVRVLHRLGHARIAHLSYERRSWSIEAREKGYAQEMQRWGLRPSITTGTPTAHMLQELIERSHPTALFCHNDWLALSAIRALSSLGLRVPDDISVMGIDHTRTFIELCPGVSSLVYPLTAVTRRAVQTDLRGSKSRRTGSDRSGGGVERHGRSG